MWQTVKRWIDDNWTNRPHKPGTVIATYLIDEVLGSGSYGIAYRARHTGTGQTVVMKQVKPSLRGTPKGEAMQAYEARVLQSLSHPAFPRFLDHFTWRRQHYLIMSHMRGETLETLLFERSAGFSEREAVTMVKRIAVLVSHLHERRIIHRDVRIPNVLLDGDRLQLIDFGLARFLGDSPAYSAESLDGYPAEKQLKRAVHPHSDLYALGHFLLFLLYSTYEAKEGQEEKSWEEELSLSPALRTILRRLLQHDPPYQNIEELIDALTVYLQGKTVSF
ncbi:serine/threonine protein kinase [Brevibacillus fluminis]|uniref:serine/threonine protein kinase n=1 Tax=Brevibacillus fluminis TaxID=511487 RepID=UPI003F8C20DB